MTQPTIDERSLHPSQKYWLALGRFVHEFSGVETLLQVFLMLEAEVTHDVAKAIFSGTNIDTAKSFINRLRELKGKPSNPMLNRIFAQLTVITRARNDLLHHGAQFNNDDGVEGTVHNLLAMPGRWQPMPVSAQILDDMTADASVIKHGLIVSMLEGFPIPQGSIAPFRAIAEAPWRYKRPSQTDTRQPHPKADHKQ